MAIGTITMILANVGLSIFNNLASSRQNKQITEKREEFERAVRDNQRERMLQLMREGQQLTLELEEQKHQERLSELNDQFDNLIKELAFANAIEHWPLKTLPIVMKNQALGNLLAKQEEHVALHCILTNSGCSEFDQYVLPKVESALEEYCNVHWCALTGSPVLFYSGAWKSNDVPTGPQIDSMHTALSNLPTLIISPFFRPQDHKLVFKVHVWGVGYSNNADDTIIDPSEEPMSETMEQTSKKRIRFQNDYTDQLRWLAEEGLIEEAVEDIVPYLQCLIGYIADTYFWSAFGSVPQLPRLLTNGTINTDGMKYLVDDTRAYYNNLLEVGQKTAKEQPFVEDNLLSLVEGAGSLWDEEQLHKATEKLFNLYVENRWGGSIQLINNDFGNILVGRKDVPILRKFNNQLRNPQIDIIINHLQNQVHCIIEEMHTCNFIDVLNWCDAKIKENIEFSILHIKIANNRITVFFEGYDGLLIDNIENPMGIVINYQKLIAPNNFYFKSYDLNWNRQKFYQIYNSINLNFRTNEQNI